ncbi:hypothetical protein DW846_01980 [Ruminococcus sp. AM36-2AA]|nr:hypothetical protein DW851_01975 [Ruminococcus sp. AM36-5]RGH62393.1 hypothetical protein DW846_01980 [Ruminococcus sp. AM36-2AA]
MQHLIKIYNVYSYSELSDEAKEKAKEDYLNDYCRSEALTDIYMEDLKNIFPNSDLKIQWSLNGCQSDGVNIYGNLNINDIFNLPNVTDMKWIGDELTEKEIRTMKFYMSEYQEDIILPMNRRYCYCYINHIDFLADFYSALENIGIRNINSNVLCKIEGIIRKIIKELCNRYERIGEDYLYNISDEEMEETSEANDWKYFKDGSFFANIDLVAKNIILMDVIKNRKGA